MDDISRFEVIRRMVISGACTVSDVEKAGMLLNKSPRTIRRWISDVSAVPLAESVGEGHRTEVKRRSILPARTIEIMVEKIEARLRKKEKIPAKMVYRQIREACEKEGLAFPCLRTVHRRLKSLSLYRKALAKMVPMEPRSAKLYPHHHTVERTLDEVQIDHTLVDLILNLEEFGLGKKRIWLTLAIDVASRMVFGYYLGLKQPNALTGGLALLQGILPKRKWVEDVGVSYDAFQEKGIDDPWPITGVPHVIACDNGKDFRSIAFRKGCAQLGSRLRFRPIGKTHYGGHIERLLGNFMHQLHAVPGTTFSNTAERKGYDAEKNAFLTLEDFEIWLVMTILEYHLTPHSGLGGKTPLQQYREMDTISPRKVDLIPDPLALMACFLPSERRKVRRHGIRYKNKWYYHAHLESLVGQTLAIKYHPARLDRVLVCLDGITPTFTAKLVGPIGRCRHIDALVDRLPTVAVQQEAERQEGVARRLSIQRDQMIDRLARQGRSVQHNAARRAIAPSSHDAKAKRRPTPHKPRSGKNG